VSATRDTEVEELRARVEQLEAQLADQARRTNTIVAEAQEKLYWLERWQVDLDKLMARPGAVRALDAVRWLRNGVRKVRLLLRR
jgi:uncharacterized coiled-coil protein SlyX